MLQYGRKLSITYIDYSAVFDSVSHRFIDRALMEADVSNKTRAMFRAVYESASAYTTVKGSDNVTVKSEEF